MPTITKTSPFTAVQPGALSLRHRVVMAPLTRSRSVQPDSVPGDLMREYYQQRASNGGFIITDYPFYGAALQAELRTTTQSRQIDCGHHCARGGIDCRLIDAAQ